MLCRLLTKKETSIFYGSNGYLDHLQPFLVLLFFDQVPNKDFALLAAGQFATRLQEFWLWGS